MFVESGVISRNWDARVLHVKVAALRLFHPTVSSVLSEIGSIIATQFLGGRGEGRAFSWRLLYVIFKDEKRGVAREKGEICYDLIRRSIG